ncbi:MAG: peptidoglycan-associated lipoprotein Pal [Gammaproteobacteria bacterium]
MKIWKLLIPVLTMAFVVGCASTDSASTDGADGGADGAVTSPGGSSDGGSSMAIDSDRDMEDLMNNTTIYFAFDSSDLDSGSVRLAKAHAAYLAKNPRAKARLEGHADERGSREYNIGLGERRAASVRSVLLANGASASQLSTISFGEERPADSGTGESAWSKNRRVEIDYK